MAESKTTKGPTLERGWRGPADYIPIEDVQKEWRESMNAMTVPQWQGRPITAGWWWLQFADGPGPRHWDGTFWDRGSYFATADDYADNPVLGPCVPPAGSAETHG